MVRILKFVHTIESLIMCDVLHVHLHRMNLNLSLLPVRKRYGYMSHMCTCACMHEFLGICRLKEFLYVHNCLLQLFHAETQVGQYMHAYSEADARRSELVHAYWMSRYAIVFRIQKLIACVECKF